MREPYFPTLGLKTWARKTPNMDTFHVGPSKENFNSLSNALCGFIFSSYFIFDSSVIS